MLACTSSRRNNEYQLGFRAGNPTLLSPEDGYLVRFPDDPHVPEGFLILMQLVIYDDQT